MFNDHLLCARHCFLNIMSFIPSNNSEKGTINTPFLRLWKLSQTEFKQSVQGHTAGVLTAVSPEPVFLDSEGKLPQMSRPWELALSSKGPALVSSSG